MPRSHPYAGWTALALRSRSRLYRGRGSGWGREHAPLLDAASLPMTLLDFVKLNPSAEDFARFNCGGIWERARRFPASPLVSDPS